MGTNLLAAKNKHLCNKFSLRFCNRFSLHLDLHLGLHFKHDSAEINDIETTVSGGVGAATYTWYRDGSVVSSGIDFTSYNPTVGEPSIFGTAGTYEFTVIDDNNCSYNEFYDLNQPSELSIVSATVTSDYNGSQVSCFGASDAIITVDFDGGNAPYSYNLVPDPPARIIPFMIS